MFTRHLVLALILTLISGCAPIISPLITTAPNTFNPLAGVQTPFPSLEEMAGAEQTFFVDVGPPQAKLAVSILNPSTRDRQPLGTVLLLHGIRGRSFWMMPAARVLTDKGYRAVLVDLRGHGRSSGSQMTYGFQESLDVSQVIDQLERRKLVAGKLGVYGLSFGAATAIQLAANDERIAAVVAVAPFSSLREEAPDYIHTALPGFGDMISKQQIQEAINQAGVRAGFNPNAVDCTAAIKQIKSPVLLLHGTSDRLIPYAHSQRLHDANPDSKLVLVENYGHVSMLIDSNATVISHGVEWFDQWLLPSSTVGSLK